MQKLPLRVLDLFAGVGGLALGFKKLVDENGFSPFDITGIVEIDRYAVASLKSAMVRQGITPEEIERRIICDDITETATKEKLHKRCPVVDIIIGGPPCQSFSTIGPRSGCKEKQQKFTNDERDTLFEHYTEIVSHYKPDFIVFENVKGILSKRNLIGEKYIDIIVQKFEELGYNLTSENENIKEKYIVLNAADYGVPQLRERVFIIGNRIGIKNPYPERTHCPPEMSKESGLLPYVNLKDAIGDLPELVARITLTPPEKGVTIKNISSERKKYIEQLNKNRNNGQDISDYHWERFNNSFADGNEARQRFLQFIKPQCQDVKLTGHIARGQQESDIVLFAGMDEGTSSKDLLRSKDQKHMELLTLIKYKMDSFEDKYKKLSWGKPCNTIFAHLQKDGNRFIHPDSNQARTLTVREAARIQSFPDDYVFEAPGNVRYKYIGNAVPPLLSMAIASVIINRVRSR